uniref:Putative secreted protein n=1 Tax=Aedes albopictus TaxID=7160 RepID=A0A023EJC6_AEDAL
MQSSSLIVGVVLLAAVVSAEFGYYIPKAFYKIDENGYKSPLTYIDNLPPLFHRTRRSAQLGGVNFGFPIQFPAFPQIPAGAGTGSFQGVQTTITSNGGGGNGNLDSRFDEGGQTVHTTFTSFNNNNGHFSQTTHYFDKDGKVTTHKHESGPGSQSNSHSQSDSPASPSSVSSPSAASPSSSPSSSSSSPNQKKN